MKKANLYFCIFAFLLLNTFSFSLYAGEKNLFKVKESNIFKVIDFVDNTKGIVVISDSRYFLRLNTKIYGNKKQKLNRYALKVGQTVAVESSYENKKNYADSIVIYSK